MSRPLLSDDDVLPFFLAVGGTCVVLSVALFLVWRYRLSLCFFPPWSRKSAEGAGPGGPAGEGESADYDEAEYNYAYGDGDDDYQYGDDERAWPWPGARPEGESAEDFYNDEAELEQGDDDDEEDSGDARQSREVVSPRPRPRRSSLKSSEPQPRSSASGSRSSSSLAKKKQPDEQHLSAAGPAAKYYQTAREEVRRSRAGAADPGEGAAATEKDHPRRSPSSGEMAMCKGDEDVNLELVDEGSSSSSTSD
mmetsp:Transcript_2158/g.5033  ORF Transcript_2158/g.5033 Transcript_2158/m.5033 type:complete len:251 (-) Transcript_2158:287-1039(-)|eukprot:g17570.t1